MTKNSKSSLTISGLELNVNLGWPESERIEKQTVIIDIDIYFAKTLKGCVTDNLDDTICYATLINDIKNQVNDKHFRLIENLTYAIYNIIKSLIDSKSKIRVTTTKHPPIEGFSGQVNFSFGDK